jgi:thiosulfate reductase cytochrome b subunit
LKFFYLSAFSLDLLPQLAIVFFVHFSVKFIIIKNGLSWVLSQLCKQLLHLFHLNFETLEIRGIFSGRPGRRGALKWVGKN